MFTSNGVKCIQKIMYVAVGRTTERIVFFLNCSSV